jgi:outer membrane immunogenic protein
MKISSFVFAALAGASSVALFAGTASAQPSGPPPGEVDWTGVYIGLNGGWNDANEQARGGTATVQQLSGLAPSTGAAAVTVPPATIATRRMDFSASGFAGGAQVGYNRQMGHIVLGVEGDMDGVTGDATQFSSYTLPPTALAGASPVNIDRFVHPEWTATIRGRAGYALGPVLLYGTGGLALADVREGALYSYTGEATGATAAANPGFPFGQTGGLSGVNSVRVGWTVGGGAEWALNRQVSLGAEYRHSDYGRDNDFLGSNAAGNVSENARLGFSNDQVLAKLNFRFGPGAQ